MTQANGGIYTYSYDKAGRLKNMKSPLGYTKNFTYDKADNIVKESDSLKSITTYTYDKLHNKKSSTNALNGTTSFTYDKYGNLLKETDPLGRSKTYSYDLAGRMTAEADPLGKITAYTYDPAGNITEITKPGGRKTSYSYDKNYNVTSVTDPMGYVVKKVYDQDNRVAEETDALGQKEAYRYDKNGRVTTAVDKRGFQTGFTYDAHGNVQVVTDKTGLKSRLEYDKNDNLTKVTDALGGVTTYSYNNMDKLITFTNAENKTTNYTYDLEGNLTSIKDPAGRTEKFDYDEKGRLTGHTQASGKKVSYDYDKLNDLLEKSYKYAKGETAEKPVTYAYNSAGERVSMKDQTGTSSYEYDALGRITKVTSGSKKEVSYIYDEADNLQAIVYPDGTKVSYEYDLNDNLVKLTDRNGKVTTYTHDARNRVTEVNRSNGTKTKVTYDAEDHITKLVNICGSCGKAISSYEYKYNEQGYVVSEEATEFKAGAPQDGSSKEDISKMPDWTKWYNWYNWYNWYKWFFGKPQTAKSGCGHQEKGIQTTRTYEYDDNWELTRCTEKSADRKETVHNYTYDKAGNRTSYEKIEGGISKEKYNYEYNDFNQLIKRTDAKKLYDQGTIYSYDEDGNRIEKRDKTNAKEPVTYEYTAENRLSVVKQGGTVLMAAMYDGDNNRVFELDHTESQKEDKNTSVLIPENQRTKDGSSPKEQLASLIKSGADAKDYTLTEYVNDINRENTEVLTEYGADGKIRKAYTYGNKSIGERVSVDSAGETGYYVHDGRASVTGITAASGRLMNSYSYDAYGNMTSEMAGDVNDYGYNAESFNTNTGLQYLRARYYDAETGTFTTEDSELGTTENPLARNRYTYAENNPLNYSDPTGHSVWGKVKKAAKSIGRKVKNVGRKIGNTLKRVTAPLRNNIKKAVNKGRATKRQITRAARAVSRAVTHPKQTYQAARNRITGSQAYRKIASKGSRFVRSVNRGLWGAGKQYSSFKSYAAARTHKIRQEIKRILCSKDVKRIQNKVETGSKILGLSVWRAGKLQIQQLQEKIPKIDIEYTGKLKDSIQLGIGLATIAGGAGMTISGGGATAISGGMAAGVSAPMVAAGIGTTVAGAAIAGTAVGNMFDVQIQKSEGKNEVKTNKGNEIDITPEDNHTSTTKNPGPYGDKNSSIDILDKDGNIKTRRWYDQNGKAYRDVDMTNHGNPKEHQEWPHEHTWKWNGNDPNRE